MMRLGARPCLFELTCRLASRGYRFDRYLGRRGVINKPGDDLILRGEDGTSRRRRGRSAWPVAQPAELARCSALCRGTPEGRRCTASSGCAARAG